MDNLRSLTCGGREIKWLLTRKKVKNVNMRIKPDGIVYISASGRVPIGYIEDFIRQKSGLIFASLERFAVRAAAPELPEADKEYRDGDTVCCFGDYYTLRIIIDTEISYASEESVVVGDKEIVVAVRYGNRAGKVLEKFCAAETERLFQSLNERTCAVFGEKGYSVPLAELQIRKMTSRWGSCHISDGKIVINSRLALYPKICAEYVFVHEYAHFIVPNHSEAFYAVVADIMPNYKVCVKTLKG